MNSLVTTNVNTNFYWIWDPNMSTRGAYVAVQLPGGTTGGSSLADQFLQPGQSVFVQTLTSGAADITFQESAKDVNPAPTTVFSDDQQMKLNLLLYKNDAYQNGEREADALMISFDENATNATDEFDAGKLGNPDENLARLNNGDYLSMEERSIPTDNESLELFTIGFSESDYVFVADLSNLQDGMKAYLTDHYTGEQTLLFNGENDVSFQVDQSIPQSTASDRFSIEFEYETFSINDNELANAFQVYPNPVEDKLYISGIENDASIRIFDLLGKQVFSSTKHHTNEAIDVSKLETGVYLVKVNDGENSFTQKTIKK